MCRICSLILVILIVQSCTSTKKGRILELLHEWNGREIFFSPDMRFTIQGGDTLKLDSIQYRYKIVSYIDSIGCVSCKLNLQKWSEFASEIDSAFLDKVCFQFVFQPSKVNELLLQLKRNRFMLPVCIDRHNQFGALNNFPKEVEFHTFLLNEQNKVIAIGNPTFSSKMKNFYLKIIQDENAKFDDGKSGIVKTKVRVRKQTISLGHFNWLEEQSAKFTLQNIGKQPLVIDDIITSCGCITVEYNKEPVRPGKCLNVKVNYKADHPEYFSKTVKIYCNVIDSPLLLTVIGNAK